jgi:hypothetical protein
LAKKRFTDLFNAACPGVNLEEAWRSFNEDLLMPLVQEVGARTYELISGSKLHLDKLLRFPEYLQRYPHESKPAVRNAIVAFLDPADSNVRSYILRHLNAYFLAEAGNLGKETLDSLAKVAEKPPAFNIFLDTNFLFSILGLHDNPSNEAAKSLMQLLAKLPRNVKTQLYVLRPTLEEARGVLGGQRDILTRIISTPNIAEAAAGFELSGIAQKFLEAGQKAGHPVNASDYFDPYINNLIRVLRSKRIELFNQDVDSYRQKQEVIDSLLDQLDFEKRKHGDKGRTYEQLLHDVVLWYFIRDKRPPQVESPLDATYWVVTVDYHFLGFDAFRRRDFAKKVPICVHPTAVIQMLQFWLPRTEEFEQAVLGSLRWPFLFQDFDPQAERVTIRILEALARFEHVGDLPKEVITTILLDDVLRNKLSFEKDLNKRVEFVKEALIKQAEKVHSQFTEEVERIREKLAAAEEEGKKLGSLTQSQHATITQLREQLKEQETSLKAASQQLEEETMARATMSKRVDDLEKHTLNAELRKQQQIVSVKSMVALFLAVIPWIITLVHRSSWSNWGIQTALAGAGLIVWTWFTAVLIKRCPAAKDWQLAQHFLRFKKLLFAALGTVVLGAIGNAVWEYVKRIH